MKKWILTENGVETEDGETVICGQYDWSTEEITTYTARHHINKLLAAPEMLEALEDLMAEATGQSKSCGHEFYCVCAGDAAGAAIAKARGES